jgi:hypothetical protein
MGYVNGRIYQFVHSIHMHWRITSKYVELGQRDISQNQLLPRHALNGPPSYILNITTFT